VRAGVNHLNSSIRTVPMKSLLATTLTLLTLTTVHAADTEPGSSPSSDGKTFTAWNTFR